MTLAERDRRWILARGEMERRGIDCLFVYGRGQNDNGNVRWLDNGDHSERTVIFPRKGTPVVMWMLPIWERWYLANSWEGFEYRPTRGCAGIAGAEAISDLGCAKGTVGVVGIGGGGFNAEGSVPYFTVQNLRLHLPEARIVDASDILTRHRMVKSAEELARIEKAAELSNVECEAMLRHCRPGVCERDLAVEMLSASLRAGNEIERDHWLIMCSGKEGYPVNRRPTERIMHAGDLVMTGNYTRFAGYYSHPHYAVSLGRLDPEYAPLREAVREATGRCLALLKPGTPWAEVERGTDEPILRRGYYHEITQMHCVGLDGIEPPTTALVGGQVPVARPPLKGEMADNPEWRRMIGDRKGVMDGLAVEAGMCVAVEVKAVSEDRIFFELGPQVVIEKDGPRILTPDAMDVIEL